MKHQKGISLISPQEPTTITQTAPSRIKKALRRSKGPIHVKCLCVTIIELTLCLEGVVPDQ